MQVGQIKHYYHGMLNQTLVVKITAITKARVSFLFLDGPWKGEIRSMTTKQADERLT